MTRFYKTYIASAMRSSEIYIGAICKTGGETPPQRHPLPSAEELMDRPGRVIGGVTCNLHYILRCALI